MPPKASSVDVAFVENKAAPRLYRAYKLKEALRLIFYNNTVENAKEALDAWFKWARHCRIPAFVELQKR